MKTLIIYGTRYGSTEKCGQLLKNELNGEIDLCNLMTEEIPDLNPYENVIIGGSIYIGQIQKEVKTFISTHLNELLTKKLGLFTCCSRKGDIAIDQINTVFGEDLLNHAVVKDYFGGEIYYKKMKFLDRLVTRMVSKADKDFPILDENKNGSFLKHEAIHNFASLMNEDKGE
ncbi:flavodoxin domain-containing protein [Mycoplasmatota bacterium]|nr:flavodoxin domain-containing protein [Mycoplasmatota bacterium]